MGTFSKVIFEWDPNKSAANEAKHGISLAAAAALWDGTTVSYRSRHRLEERYLAVGLLDEKHWTVVYTRRGDRIRLISARRSRTDEETLYENNCRKP